MRTKVAQNQAAQRDDLEAKIALALHNEALRRRGQTLKNDLKNEAAYAIADIRQKLVEEGVYGRAVTPQHTTQFSAAPSKDLGWTSPQQAPAAGNIHANERMPHGERATTAMSPGHFWKGTGANIQAPAHSADPGAAWRPAPAGQALTPDPAQNPDRAPDRGHKMGM
jgi:hypothetical protein